jgi:tetratricopeptide (TPR) repeat protein
MNHPSLVERPDTVALLEKLHEIAPYDEDISFNLLRFKYKNGATFAQKEAVYRPVLEFSSYQMFELSKSITDQPQEYEKLLLKAARLDPFSYYLLGNYFQERGNEQKAAAYLEQAIDLGPDPLSAAENAGWLIRYYLKKGDQVKASKLADLAGEVYSHAGLLAKAQFLEATGKPSEAFDWYSKIAERYDSSAEFLSFAYRYRIKTGDTRFDSKISGPMKELFPKGVEKVAFADLKSPPLDGALLEESNEFTERAGLKVGDVIVSLYGIRTHNFAQYVFARESVMNPRLDLVIWRKNQYLPLQASPPGRRFSLDFADYKAR